MAKRLVVPKIDETNCIGCGACEDVCLEEAISMKEREGAQVSGLSPRVAYIKEGVCTGCMDCIDSCSDISWPEGED